MAAQREPCVTAEEYLAQDRAADVRSEYYNGVVVAMAGGTESHSLLAANTLASLHAQLHGRNCRVYQGDIRVDLPRINTYVYPDVSVVCGPSQLADNRRDILLNPTVVIEVLSPSTANFDRGGKFLRYRTLDSLQEYVLIAQDEYRIERYVRQPDNQWLFAEAVGLEASIDLPSISCRLALTDVYEQVTLG